MDSESGGSACASVRGAVDRFDEWPLAGGVPERRARLRAPDVSDSESELLIVESVAVGRVWQAGRAADGPEEEEARRRTTAYPRVTPLV